MKLPGRISAGGAQEISRYLIICREIVDSNMFSAVVELGRVAHDAVIGDLEPAVQAIEKIEPPVPDHR